MTLEQSCWHLHVQWLIWVLSLAMRTDWIFREQPSVLAKTWLFGDFHRTRLASKFSWMQPVPNTESLFGDKRWPVVSLYAQLLEDLIRITYKYFRKFPLHWIFHILPQTPSIPAVSPCIPSRNPISPSLPHLILLFSPHSSPVYSNTLFYCCLSGIHMCHPKSLFLYLDSLSIWSIAWLPFIYWLMFTYKWIYTIFNFLGLNYITQNDFYLFPSFCLQTIWFHFLTAELYSIV